MVNETEELAAELAEVTEENRKLRELLKDVLNMPDEAKIKDWVAIWDRAAEFGLR